MSKIALESLEQIPCLSRRTLNTIIKELTIPVDKEKKGRQYISTIDESYLPSIIIYIFTTRSLTQIINSRIDITKRKNVTQWICSSSYKTVIRELEEHISEQSRKLKQISNIIESGDSSNYLDVLSSLAESTIGVSEENVVVLDTSVFHAKPTILDELVTKFSRIIIPSVVVRELNYQKDNKNKKIDKKKISLILSTIRHYKDSLVLSDNIQFNETQDHISLNNDDLIIKVAQKEVSNNVYILTEDGDFEIKCKDISNVTPISLKDYELMFNSTDDTIDYQKTMEFISAVKDKDINKIKNMDLQNVDINTCGDDGKTALITAVRNRDISMINTLINYVNVDLNTLDKYKYKMPALTHAVMINNSKIIELLLKNKADVNLGSQGCNRGNTPLMVASWNGKSKLVKILLKQKDICINQQDSNGFTPLIKATIKNNIDVVSILLKHGADKNIRSVEDKTALDYARDNLHSMLDNRIPNKIIELLK